LEGVTFVKGESDFLQETRPIISPNPKILFDKMFFIFQNICEANVNIKTKIAAKDNFLSLIFLIPTRISPPLGWRKFVRIFDGVVFRSER
jgi:hypothetical protein